MKHPFIFPFILIFVTALSSIGCKDDEIELSKTPHDPSLLRTDGYYYFFEKGDNDGITSILFIYDDGTSLRAGGTRSLNFGTIDNQIRNEYLAFDYQTTKYKWGVFRVENQTIKFEHWFPSSGGRLKTVIWEGDLIDSSSFVINYQYSNYTNQSYSVSDTFHFRPFSPKPDSTNTFIR